MCGGGESTEASGSSPPAPDPSVTWDSARRITPVTTVTVSESEQHLTLGIPERKVGGGAEAPGLADVRREPGDWGGGGSNFGTQEPRVSGCCWLLSCR